MVRRTVNSNTRHILAILKNNAISWQNYLSTVSLAPKQGPVLEKLTFLCHQAIAVMSSSHDMMGNWRIPALEQELGRLKCYTLKTLIRMRPLK